VTDFDRTVFIQVVLRRRLWIRTVARSIVNFDAYALKREVFDQCSWISTDEA